MKALIYGLLTGTLLALAMMGTGCAANPNDPDIFELVGRVGQPMTQPSAQPQQYRGTSTECTTIQDGTDWYGNPRLRTVCQ